MLPPLLAFMFAVFALLFLRTKTTCDALLCNAHQSGSDHSNSNVEGHAQAERLIRINTRLSGRVGKGITRATLKHS